MVNYHRLTFHHFWELEVFADNLNVLNERTNTEDLVHCLVSGRPSVGVCSFCPLSLCSLPSQTFPQTRILVCRRDFDSEWNLTSTCLELCYFLVILVFTTVNSKFKLGIFCCNCWTQLTALDINLSTSHAFLIPPFSEQPALKCAYCPGICS